MLLQLLRKVIVKKNEMLAEILEYYKEVGFLEEEKYERFQKIRIC